MQEVTNPQQGNPALENAYKLAQSKGYKKDINSFKTLISSDEVALNNIYNEVKTKGYKKDINSFKELVGVTSLKKKDGTKPNSTSTSVSPKQVSEQTNGSSGSLKQPEYEYKPIKDERGREVYEKDASGNLVPKKEKVLKGYASSTEEREIVREEVKQKALKPIKTSVNLQKYQEATKPTEQEINDAVTEIDDKINQKGFGNGFATGLKKGANFLSDVFTTIGTFGTETKGPNFDLNPYAKEEVQAKKELTEEFKGDTSKFSNEDVIAKTKQIALDKKIEGLKIDKNQDFLSNLPENDKRALELESIANYKTISAKDKYLATEASILINETEKNAKDYNVVKSIVLKNNQEGKQTPKEILDYGIELENKLKNSVTEATKLENKISENTNDIGSTEEEIDFLKRNYNMKDKFITNVKLGFGDIYMNLGVKQELAIGDAFGVIDEERKQEIIDQSIDWENAKQIYKNKESRDVSFENLSVNNFGEFFFQELGTQVAIFAQIAMPGGVTSIGLTSAFDKYSQMEMESNQITFLNNGKQYSGYEKENGKIVSSDGFEFDRNDVTINSLQKADYNKAQMISTAIGFGAAEAVLGAMPTKGILSRSVRSFEQAGQRQLLRESGKQYLKRKGVGIIESGSMEAVTEGLTQVTQNLLDKSVLGKTEVGLFDNVSHAAFSGGMLGGAMTMMPTVAGLMMKPFSENKQSKEVNENLQMIFNLQEQLNNSSIEGTSRQVIQDKISALETRNKEVLTSIANKTKGISEEVFNAIVDVNKKQEILRIQATEINADPNLDKKLKDQLISDLESQFNTLESKRSTLVSDKVTVLDALSDTESTKLKQQAAAELIKQSKSEGKTDEQINFTEEEVNKKAIEIYNQSKANAVQQEATITETKQEAQPQAEVKAEVGEVNQKILDLEQQRDTEIEALKEKRLYDTKYIEPIREKYNNLILEEKSKGFDLFHTGNEGLSIESVSVDPRVTRQGKKGKYGGFYTYDNIGNIISFLKGNKTSTVYGIKLNDGVEITDYNGSIERLNAEKLQELRDSGVKVIRGKSIVGKTEIIVVDKSAIKSIEKINEAAPSQVDNVDGNVQPGNNVVEPSGTTEQENNQAGDVQPTDNGRNVEGENQPKIDTSGIGTENYKQRKSQIKGRKREITIADGSKIKGQYKVVSADDILASHNEENFSKTEGYPVNERGETINDRDYERDKNAQAEVSKIAQDYDGRAIQQTPVVTKEGIVVDGNNRVMSRKLAAKKVTDTKYKEVLVNEADMYGINPDEIANVKNPIIVFEVENEMPYNTETLAKFNKQDKKEKSSSGKAVEFSKTLSDRAKRQIAEVYDQAERPSDVTSDVKAVKQLRDILLNNNIIQSNEIPRYFDVDKGVMTKEGVSLMENIALGSVFNEKTINTLSLQGMGDIRNKILQSLVGLINNASLEEKYRLGNEISKAIEVIYQLKTTKQSIEEYLDQPDLYGEKFIPNIDEYATILAISDSGFKKWLQNYNNNVGQPDIFKAEGDGITTKRDKTNETITERKKQVPSNLRSDATINESQNGQADAEVGGEIENKPDDKQDVETLEELGKPEVTPEEKQIQNNKKDEFDNTDLEDDTEAQPQAEAQAEVAEVETPQAGSVGVVGDAESRNIKSVDEYIEPKEEDIKDGNTFELIRGNVYDSKGGVGQTKNIQGIGLGDAMPSIFGDGLMQRSIKESESIISKATDRLKVVDAEIERLGNKDNRTTKEFQELEKLFKENRSLKNDLETQTKRVADYNKEKSEQDKIDKENADLGLVWLTSQKETARSYAEQLSKVPKAIIGERGDPKVNYDVVKVTPKKIFDLTKLTDENGNLYENGAKLEEIENLLGIKLESLPDNPEYAYQLFRGRNAKKVVELLKEKGYDVVRLKEGNQDNFVLLNKGKAVEQSLKVTPEEKQIQNNKKDEFDNTDLEDDTKAQAQGFFNGSKQNERDLALSDNGPVKLRFPFQKTFKRVWANTFKSNSGLSKESGEVVRSRNRILATYTDHINQEAIAFDKIIKDVKKLFPKEFNQKLIEINNYLSGDKNADISFLNQEQIDKIDYFRDRIDSSSKSLITLLEDKMSSMKNKQAIESTKELIETIKQNMGIYITRNYQIFSDDNYRDMITGDFENINKEGQLRIRNAINYLIREEGLTKDEATKSVAEYLAEIRRKKNDFFVQSSGNAVSNFFKKRKGIPKEFRELLGESKDPTYNYINTVYKISQYLGNIEYQYNLREHLINNQIASLEPKLGYEKIVGSSEGWRILNDIYVPVEFKEAFDDMQPLQTIESGFYKTWIKIAGIVKINKTVLSPTTAARNLLSGIFLGANSGHFFLLKPSSAANAWNQAWSTKKTQKELFNERQKLIKLGVLGDGVNSGELMALLNDFSKEVDRMINKNAFELFFEKAKQLYAFGDDFYKVSGFYIERDRLIKSGLSELEAENKAAYRINKGYPTYSYLPKNIQRLRRLPLIGTFVSFPYETIRSTKNNIYFIKEDLEEGRTKMAYQRAAGMIVANATLGGLNMLTMSMFGLTDDDDNAIRDMLPEWQKNSKLIYLGTKNEKPVFIDGTALFPSEVIFKPISILLEKRKGREFEDKLKIATNEVLSPYISKDISFKTLTEIFENENEFNEKIYLSDNLLEGVFNESEKILNYLMRQAGPGVYNNVTEFLRANEIKPNFFGDKFSAYGKEYTNQEALLGLLGFRISTLNYNAAMSSYAYQVKQSETEDKRSSNKLVKTSKKLTNDEIKVIVEDYAKYHNENYKQMVNIVSSGKKLGMSNMEIKKSLKLSKISDNDIRDLLKGKVPRLSPMSTQTKSNFKQKLKINYKGKDINEILKNFESNFIKMNIEIRQYNRTKIE